MTLPNFVIIGGMRCATTTVHYMLDQHPQIHMSPVKETNFFKSAAASKGESGDGALDLEKLGISPAGLREYEDLFRDADNAIAIGETSPAYLYYTGSANLIRALIPDARLIAILRHPVDRAYSHYVRKRAAGLEKETSFARTLEREVKGSAPTQRYKETSLYARHLARYFGMFEASQILVCLYDDLERDAAGFYRQIFRFLQVDDSCELNSSKRFNQSGRVKNRKLDRLVRSTINLRGLLKRRLPPSIALPLARKFHAMEARNYTRDSGLAKDLRQKLTDRHFRSDILELQTLLGRDLSHWLR